MKYSADTISNIIEDEFFLNNNSESEKKTGDEKIIFYVNKRCIWAKTNRELHLFSYELWLGESASRTEGTLIVILGN